MEKDLIDIVELMECPRLNEWEEINRLVEYDKRIIYLLSNVFNYGKMKGKQEVRNPAYRTLKKMPERFRDPKMTVHQYIEYLGRL